MSKQKTAVSEEQRQAQAVFERRVRRRFQYNTLISIVLAVVVTFLSAQNYELGTALLRGVGIGLLVWLYFYISYRRLMR